MDGQRQYPGEPDRWYADNPAEDELGRVPGQRSAERYPEPPDDGSGRVYGEPQPYGGHEAPDYGTEAPGYGRDEPDYTDPHLGQLGRAEQSDQVRRRRTGRPVRVGRRSGLELPEVDPASEYDTGDEASRYRSAERIDRQALRREGQTYQSGFDAPLDPGFDPLGRPNPASLEQPTADRAPADRMGFGERAEAYPTVSPPFAPAAAPPGQIPNGQIPSAPTQMTQAIPTGAAPTAVYLAKRPAIGVLIATVGIVIELLLVRVLFAGEFGHAVDAGDVLGGLFAMVGVPMVGLGLYGLACGAATAGGPSVARTWMRPPLAYLPVGLLLLIAAGLAA